VHTGLACFAVVATVLVVVTAIGDRVGALRNQASNARAI
jgi:hypothetical protein